MQKSLLRIYLDPSGFRARQNKSFSELPNLTEDKINLYVLIFYSLMSYEAELFIKKSISYLIK